MEGKKFSFGKNWQVLLRGLTEERVRIAEHSITDFLHMKDLEGKSFLDIGCGSGLFSQAAFNLKARTVVSFDYDPFSVECCNHLKEKSGSPENWEVYEESVLDREFTSGLGKFDIVYSWGVLHHTGSMWEAIKNAAELVNKGGFLYITLYNRTGWPFGSEFWLKVKMLYNSLPDAGKKTMEFSYLMSVMFKNFLRLRNPLTEMKNYKSHRGMSWRTDITDWLGGYPYESATAEEVTDFMKANLPGFRLVNIKRTSSAMGNNWFLFKNGE